MRILERTKFIGLTGGSGIVVSFFTGGAFCGAGLAGLMSDRLGRRWTIVIGSLIYLLGGGLQTGAQNLNFLWAGRWLAGLGVGILVMISKFGRPAVELVSSHTKARLIFLQSQFINLKSHTRLLEAALLLSSNSCWALVPLWPDGFHMAHL